MVDSNKYMELYNRYKSYLTKKQASIYEYCISLLEKNCAFMEYAKQYNKKNDDAYTDNMYATVNYKMCCLREARRLDHLNIFSGQSKEIILDIGCGTGYFSWFAKQAGHTVYSLDAPLDSCGRKIFIQGQKVFGLNMLYHTIQPFQSLPKPPQPCTLAVAFSPQFYNPLTDDFWKEAEWRFFLKDLASCLTPDGKIYFHLNLVSSRPEFDVFGSEETKELFMSLGTVRGHQNYIINMDAQAIKKLG